MLSKRDCSLHQVHGAAVEAAAWRSSNLSCWSCHAAGLEQHIAAEAGRKAALRLGGLARVTVEVFWDEGVCGQHVDRAEAQIAAAMQQGKCDAIQAAMAKEQDPASLHLVNARSRAPHYVSAAQDVLDFLVDLLSLGQPAVTQESSGEVCVRSLFCGCRCGSGRGGGDRLRAAALPAARAGNTGLVGVCWGGDGVGMTDVRELRCVSQAARHRYVNRPQSIWEAYNMLVRVCACLGSCQLVAGPDLARCEDTHDGCREQWAAAFVVALFL